VDVPSRPASTIRMSRSCTACFVLSAVFVPIGIPLIAAGTVLLDESTTTKAYWTGDYYSYRTSTDEVLEAGSTSMIATGAVFATAGLTLLIIGIAHGGTGASVDRDRSPSRGATPFQSGPIGLAPSGLAVSF
jgi:hypothetical protein